jgi:hypothetical protein
MFKKMPKEKYKKISFSKKYKWIFILLPGFENCQQASRNIKMEIFSGKGKFLL